MQMEEPIQTDKKIRHSRSILLSDYFTKTALNIKKKFNFH